MNHSMLLGKSLLAAMLAMALVGCGSQSGAPLAEAEHDEHAHESGGPHGGTILELGQYHAEIVHDDAAGTVTAYILDGAAAKNVPVDATEATINVTHDGKGEQFKLTASPVEGEPAGRSSRFVSSEAELSEDLDREGANAAFVITVNGAPLRAAIEHEHGHEEGHEEHEAEHAH